jgi:hypothetical protein
MSKVPSKFIFSLKIQHEVIAIKVKSHLEVRDVKRFLQTLDSFKKSFLKHKNDKLYGAVAGIKIEICDSRRAISDSTRRKFCSHCQ